MPDKFPHNTCLQIILMIEGADFQDLVIIFEQMEEQKDLYTLKELNDMLFCFRCRRETLESEANIERIKKRMQ